MRMMSQLELSRYQGFVSEERNADLTDPPWYLVLTS